MQTILHQVDCIISDCCCCYNLEILTVMGSTVIFHVYVNDRHSHTKLIYALLHSYQINILNRCHICILRLDIIKC